MVLAVAPRNSPLRAAVPELSHRLLRDGQSLRPRAKILSLPPGSFLAGILPLKSRCEKKPLTAVWVLGNEDRKDKAWNTCFTEGISLHKIHFKEQRPL